MNIIKYLRKSWGDLHIDIENEQSWGLGWKGQHKCRMCAYKSKLYKLYKAIETGKPGPNPADLNYLVHVGLSHGATSSSGLCKVFLSMNMPSPFQQSMQRSANQVGQFLIKENQANMKQIRELLNAPISVAMDGTYNNRLGSKKAHLECNLQHKQYILPMKKRHRKITLSMLWSKTSYARHNAKTPEKVICPNHPGKCTANISL